MPKLFTIASDETLCALVTQAKERLVVVAPGLSREVASVLASRIRSADCPPILSVILDVDPEVCRLGFGDIDAVDLLSSALTTRCSSLQLQKGVRIGLVVADAEILIYSPTPRLIEAGSNSEEKPNAIRIAENGAQEIAVACGVGQGANAAVAQEVGLNLVSTPLVAKTKADLKENPPREFDLARLERVFNYRLEFVEFSISHFRLNTRSVSLPAELLGLAEESLQDRLHNTFRVFEAGVPFEFEMPDPENSTRTVKVTEKWLTQRADKLRKEYFIPLGSSAYGNLILKRRKAEFQENVAKLTVTVNRYADKVRENIKAKVAATRDELIAALLPRVAAAPPQSWLQRSIDGKLEPWVLAQLLEKEVTHAFEDVEESYDPTVACVFKGVNYETITADEHFRQRIQEYFGPEEAKRLLSEYDASRAQENTTL